MSILREVNKIKQSARLLGESFSSYRRRLRNEKAVISYYIENGIQLWDSRLGPYVRKRDAHIVDKYKEAQTK